MLVLKGLGASSYISLRYPGESDIRAIFNNGITRATEVDIDIFTVVHAELSARDDDDTVIHSSNMCWSVDMTTDQQTFLNVRHRQAGVWLAVRSWDRHVNNTVS